MQALIEVTIPVFGILLAGYLSGRYRLLGAESTVALNGFVFYIALPALFFKSITTTPIDQIFNLPFLGAVLGGQLLTFAFAMVVASFAFPARFGETSLHATAAIFSNTGYMGIPLMITAFGTQATLPAVIATVINGAIMMAIGIILLEIDRSQPGHGNALIPADGAPMRHRGLMITRDVLWAVLKSPLVLAALAGLAVSATEISLPGPIFKFFDLLAAAAGPCALFAMGLFMVGQSVRNGAAEVVWVTFLKLFVHPALTWWLASELLQMPPLWSASAVVMAALPTGGLVFVLAQKYQVYLNRAAAIILLSTILSVPTVSLVLEYYRG